MQSYFISRHQKTKIIVLVSFPLPAFQPSRKAFSSPYAEPRVKLSTRQQSSTKPQSCCPRTHTHTHFWETTLLSHLSGRDFQWRSLLEFITQPRIFHVRSSSCGRVNSFSRGKYFQFSHPLATSWSLRRKATFLIILKVIKKNLCSKRKLSLPSSTGGFSGRVGGEKQVLRKSHCERCATFPPFGVVCVDLTVSGKSRPGFGPGWTWRLAVVCGPESLRFFFLWHSLSDGFCRPGKVFLSTINFMIRVFVFLSCVVVTFWRLIGRRVEWYFFCGILLIFYRAK